MAASQVPILVQRHEAPKPTAVPDSQMPKIRARNATETEELEHLFRNADTLLSSPASFGMLSAASTAVYLLSGPVSIIYRGKRVGFSFEHDGPFADPDPYQANYIRTNETLGLDIVGTLSGIRDATHYLGVAGGPDGNIARIGLLSYSSALEHVRLVDINITQALVNLAVFFDYDRRLSAKYVDHLYALGSVPFLPAISNIDVAVDNIIDTIDKADSHGTYFIYLSNAFSLPVYVRRRGPGPVNLVSTLYLGRLHTLEMLKHVSDNENILDGSYVMFAEANGGASMIIRKQGDTFVPYSYASNGRRTGIAEIDMELQQAFFNLVRRDIPSIDELRKRMDEIYKRASSASHD